MPDHTHRTTADKKSLPSHTQSDVKPQEPFKLPNAALLTPADIMRMQSICGNRAVQRWLANQTDQNTGNIQRTPDDDTDTIGEFDDFFPKPEPEIDEDYSRRTSQRRISNQLQKKKKQYRHKLRFARSVDDIKQIKADYGKALDAIHTDADRYFKIANEAKPDNLSEEQKLYADNMRVWAQEMAKLTDVADHEAVEKVVWNLYWEDLKNEAVHIVIDAYGFSTEGAKAVIYHPTLGKRPGDNDDSDSLRGRTGREKGTGDLYVFIGDAAFQNYPVLVHTIAHELEHLRQLREGVPDKPLREFLSEAVELIGKDLPKVDITHFAGSAAEALEKWLEVSPQYQDDYWDRFEEVREKVVPELERVGFPEFTDIINGYKAVARP
jgi:hypothetical protein